MSKSMSQADHFWYSMDDPVNLMIITGFWEFNDTIDYNRLYATLEAGLASFPRFRQRVVRPITRFGQPQWTEDPNYDLKSHLRRIALPGSGGKNELQKMVSQLITTPLDHTKPLWDVHLIENFSKGSVLFFRLHHCIADGIALMHVLHLMAETQENAPWPEPKAFEKRFAAKRPVLFPLQTFLSSAKQVVEKGMKISAIISKEIKNISANPDSLKFWMKLGAKLPADVGAVLSKYAVMKADPPTAFKGKLGVSKKMVWTKPVPLDQVKSIGKVINSATINDVLISLVTGAMRRYLMTRNTRVNDLDLKVTVPVNIRKPGTEFELGNKFSLVFLPLPVYLDDPVLRLKEVKRRMDALKVSADPYVNFGLLSAIGYLPAGLALKAARLFGDKASCVLTNVPGPKTPLYFCGKEIKNIMFWVPRSGAIGLGISIFSYNGKVAVGVASDKGLMPDPEKLLEGFEQELEELINMVAAGKMEPQPLVLHDRSRQKNGNGPQPASAKDEMPANQGRCSALTKAGKPCRNKALKGGSYCHIHQGDNHENRKDPLLEDVVQIMKSLAD